MNSSGEEPKKKTFADLMRETKEVNTPKWFSDWQAKDRLENMDLTNVTSMDLLASHGGFSPEEVQMIGGNSRLNQSFNDLKTVEMQARVLRDQNLTAKQMFQSSVGTPNDSSVIYDGMGNSTKINSNDTLGMKSLRAVNDMKEGIGELAQSLHVDKVMLAAQVLMGPVAAGKAMLQGVLGEAAVGEYVSLATDYVATRVNALAHKTTADFIETGLTIDPQAANIPEQDRRTWGNIRGSFTEAQGGAKFLVGATASLILGMGTKAWVGSGASPNVGGRYEVGAINPNGGTFNRHEITDGFQDHHIFSDKNPLTKNHELLGLSGFDLQSRSNKIFLPSKEGLHPTRSIHNGRHLNSVSENLANQMDTVLEFGKQNSWTQDQYRRALDAIISNERGLLKSGDRALNKNARPWSN